MTSLTPSQRTALLDELGAAMREPRACPILQALHLGCGAAGIGATQEEIDELAREMRAEGSEEK